MPSAAPTARAAPALSPLISSVVHAQALAARRSPAAAPGLSASPKASSAEQPRAAVGSQLGEPRHRATLLLQRARGGSGLGADVGAQLVHQPLAAQAQHPPIRPCRRCRARRSPARRWRPAAGPRRPGARRAPRAPAGARCRPARRQRVRAASPRLRRTTACSATSRGRPSVSVPVLSNATMRTACASSSACASLIRMPWRAATPVPTMIAVGVARPSAHGQAITSTATALSSPCVH